MTSKSTISLDSISLQCFVKRSMLARVRYQRNVSLNAIIIVLNI